MDVAQKYDLNQVTIYAFLKSLGWKNRREAGIIYRPNEVPDKKAIRTFLEGHTITQAAQHFGIGWKAMKDIKKSIIDENGAIKMKRVGGCNEGCQNWAHCTTTRPGILPCEVNFFEDEFIEMDEDSAIYYYSPDLEKTVRIMS